MSAHSSVVDALGTVAVLVREVDFGELSTSTGERGRRIGGGRAK